MLIFLFILTFTNIGILILLGAVMRESRHQKRSGGQLPASTPGAGGQASQRPVSGASAEQLPQVNPAQQHAAEAQRSRFPARNCGDARSGGNRGGCCLAPFRSGRWQARYRGPDGLRRIWMPALAATGLPGIHFHLRHAGNLFIANAGETCAS